LGSPPALPGDEPHPAVPHGARYRGRRGAALGRHRHGLAGAGHENLELRVPAGALAARVLVDEQLDATGVGPAGGGASKVQMNASAAVDAAVSVSPGAGSGPVSSGASRPKRAAGRGRSTPNASYSEWHHTDPAGRTASARSLNRPEICATSCIIAANASYGKGGPPSKRSQCVAGARLGL
jgi:hypothetical protein